MADKDGQKHILPEHWDTDPSASDDESFENELVQDDVIRIPGTEQLRDKK